MPERRSIFRWWARGGVSQDRRELNLFAASGGVVREDRIVDGLEFRAGDGDVAGEFDNFAGPVAVAMSRSSERSLLIGLSATES